MDIWDIIMILLIVVVFILVAVLFVRIGYSKYKKELYTMEQINNFIDNNKHK